MVASKSEFKYLSVMTMVKDGINYYQLRLSSSLGRKTVGLGRNYIQALNIALEVDEFIQSSVTQDRPIEIDGIKLLVKERLDNLKDSTTKPLRIVEKDSLEEIWDKYARFHQSTGYWEESYIATHIAHIRSLLSRCPYQRLEQKDELLSWIFSESTRRKPKTSKDRFKLIVAAIDWASKRGIIPRFWGIEYRDLLETVNVKPGSEEKEIDIFSVAEVYKILEALKNNSYSRFKGKHSQYWAYAYFCWLTGCRPSEAIALKWENVDLDNHKIYFCEAEVTSKYRHIKKKGTKTVYSRTFPVNQEIEELLRTQNPGTGYVFTTANDKPVNHCAFREIWRGLLDNLGIRYRTPYQLRHTMISYHANNDFPLHKLATLVGNSEDIIKTHYLKLDIERIGLPDVVKPIGR
ncbi:MAG: site-specific integrase [Desertifilum sp. SIO1I2]|nr:site-specific integrase [Desertifilum sp. SIO1I2]